MNAVAPNLSVAKMHDVLAVGAQKSYGTTMAELLAFVTTEVTPAVVPDSGHWIREGQPAFAVKLIKGWLETGKL